MATSIGSSAAATPEARALLAASRDVLQQFAVLIRNSYLHDLTNEVFAEPLKKLEAALGGIVKTEASFRLERVGQEFYANGMRIRMEIRSLQTYKYLWEELNKRELGGFQFEGTPSPAMLSGLLTALARVRSASMGGVAEVNQALTQQGLTNIQALPPRAAEDSTLNKEQPDRRQRAIQAYQQALDFIRESISNLDSPAQLNLRQAKRTVQKLVDLSFEEGDGFSLAGMASIKDHDNYTFNHMVNVSVLAIAFGQRLGLKRQDLAQLGLCALYHDMGKLHIPLDVLNKKGSLSEEEWAVMGNHTVYAARTLFPLIADDPGTLHRILTALQHHIGYDGKGYPDLKLRTRQGLFTRMVSITDTFDAMTTKRIYQRQFLPSEALAIIQKGAGTRYDPLLVKAFINCMGVFPIGSTVLVTTGELGVVVESNPDPDRAHQPRVKIITDAKRSITEPQLVDLSHPSQAGRAIVKCVDPELFGINSAHYVV
ncbi:MAG TPA: HD-GYP domain-containing protein [Vicinamibacteria bacterium]|jgi:HD-GYP domain-containing protein (c-di-GMP phosphodiesterase class II)